MAELSKVVATDCFLPLINARVQVRARTCETVASDLGLWGGGGGLIWNSGFPHHSRISLNIAEKVTIIEI